MGVGAGADVAAASPPQGVEGEACVKMATDDDSPNSFKSSPEYSNNLHLNLHIGTLIPADQSSNSHPDPRSKRS